MNSQVSQAIILLRFPLIFLVVTLHCVYPLYSTIEVEAYPVAYYISSWLYLVLSRIAVPLFFTISGYCFFKEDESEWEGWYKKRLSKRFRTLCVPYILWIALYLLFFWSIAKLGVLPPSSSSSSILSYDFYHIVCSFINCNLPTSENKLLCVLLGAGQPYALHFWFIRDLIVVCLFTPLLKLLVYSRFFVGEVMLALLILLWILNMGIEANGHYYLTAFAFFYLGIYLRLRRYDLIILRDAYWLFFVYVFGSVLECIILNDDIVRYLHNINVVIGILVSFMVALRLSDRVMMPRLLSKSTFFIYAAHYLLAIFLGKLIINIVPLTDFNLSISVLLLPVICTCICVLAFVVLHRLFPKLTIFLVGGR